MARQIIKQPNGLYAEYSTIVGAFIFWDSTVDEIIAGAREQAANDAEKNYLKMIAIAERGDTPFIGLSCEDAVENHNKNYPKEKISVD